MKLILPLTVALASLCPCMQSHADQLSVRSGVNRDLLDSAMDTADTKIILNSIIETGFFGRLKHTTKVFETTDGMMEAVERDEIDVFGMTTGPFFRHKGKEIEPALVLEKNGKTTVNYVLLANTKESEGKTLEDYEGASISTVETGTGEMRMCWLDTALDDAGLPLHGEFFAEPTLHQKPNEAAIPVYFGKEDLCLLSEGSWDVLALLNPQMKKRLRVIARSPGVLEGVLMYRKALNGEAKKEATKALVNLGNTPAGAQVLRLGKIDKIVPFDPKDLEASQEIYERAMRLRKPVEIQTGPEAQEEAESPEEGEVRGDVRIAKGEGVED